MQQPRALKYFFLTEMWERFGFYVIQSMLVIFLVKVLSFSDTKSYAIFGEFTAWVYIAPLAGGLLADRILGFRYTVFIGGVLLALGYFTLAAMGDQFVLLSLSMIVCGNGLLKPNISSYLGLFYFDEDPRRHAGYTIFYMGINVGALMATAFAGFLQEYLGWSASFYAAALGMTIGIAFFFAGFKFYEGRGLPHFKKSNSPLMQFLANKYTLLAEIVLAVAVINVLLNFVRADQIILTITVIALLALLISMAMRFPKTDRNKILVLIMLIVVSVVFWAMFFQIFAVVNVFTERNIDRHLFGLSLPPTFFISLEPIFILLMGPILAKLWQHLQTKRKDISIGLKFTFGMVSTTLATFMLYLAIHVQGLHLISAYWLVPFYFLLTLGEMLISPIGLAAVTEFAPTQLTGLLMGAWFMAIGVGGWLSGYLSSVASVPKAIANNVVLSNPIYAHAFFIDTLWSLIAAVVLLAAIPMLNRLAAS